MPRTYGDYMKEVGRIFPQIGPGERDDLVWKAIKDICNENDLSFMIAEGRIVTEPEYDTGTVAVTSGGTAVTLTGGTWTIGWENRKIVIEGQPEVYDITIPASTTAGVLGAAWEGDTDSGLTYRMFRDKYAVPSTCEFSKELLIWDTDNDRKMDIVDFLAFQREKRSAEFSGGTPTCVARVDLTAAGVPQLVFGPDVPSEKIVYTIDFYKKPTKPANAAASLSPAWPDAFERVIWERAIWQYADAKSHPRRFEFEQRYKKSIFAMNAKFNGADEMSRRVARTVRRGSGISVRVRYNG